MPGLGCVAVNICDMLPPGDMLQGADMASMPDLLMSLDMSMPGDMPVAVDMSLDMLAHADAGGAMSDARMNPPKDGPDGAFKPDMGVPEVSEIRYVLPLEITGGACQVGHAGAPAPSKLLGLIVLGLLLRRRRRT